MFPHQLTAPFHDGCTSMCWCFGQCFPYTCGCTQYLLRRKVLDGDMSRYVCCQGYVRTCGFGPNMVGEQNCPDFCLCVEACFCNGCAVSASRMYIMDKYDLSSDPCDYRLIRINNCLQMLACICDILGAFIQGLETFATFINRVADLFFHCVSGCMTAQVVKCFSQIISFNFD